MPGIDEETLTSRIEFAISQYTDRNAVIDDIIQLIQQDFGDVAGDVEGQGLREGSSVPLEMVKPGRAQAIVNKYITSFLHSSDIRPEVMPLRRAGTRGEDALCANAEYFLRGIIDESSYETHNAWLHSGVWWNLCGGMMTFKTLYMPQLRDTDQFPIKIFAPDTREVFPIYANKSILYMVEQYERYVMDLQAELEALQVSSGRRKNWSMPSFLDEDGEELDGTEEVTVTEYWDDTYHALRVGEEVVWNKRHEYPCLPYALGFCLPTPLADPAWKGRPVLASVQDSLKQEALLLTKLQTGVQTSFFPIVLVKSEHGELIQLQTGPGFPSTHLEPDTEVTVINPQPAIGILNAMLSSIISEISRNTLPEIMWAQPPSPARSGYAEEVRFGGTEADLQFMARQIAGALAHAFSNILRITEAFAREDGFSVYAHKWGQERHELVTMKSGDIDGHYTVRVRLKPRLSRELLQQVQMARFMREVGPDGQPLFPRSWIWSDVFNVEDPLALEKQLDQEMLSQNPLVRAYREEKAIEEFRKKEGISKKQWEELKARLAVPAVETEPPIQLPIPPARQLAAGPGAPPGGPMAGGLPWGMSPEMMPPEEGGLGRAQQLSPSELAALAGQTSGRPPGEA